MKCKIEGKRDHLERRIKNGEPLEVFVSCPGLQWHSVRTQDGALEWVEPCPGWAAQQQEKKVREIMKGHGKDFSFKTYQIYNELHGKQVEHLKAFSKRDNPFTHAFVHAPIESGKTHLAFALLDFYVKSGISTIYKLSDDIKPIIQTIDRNFYQEVDEAERRMVKIENAEILIIDELGGETFIDCLSSGYRRLFEKRLNYGKLIVFSMHTLEDLEAVYGAPVTSRLTPHGRSHVIALEGRNRR